MKRYLRSVITRRVYIDVKLEEKKLSTISDDKVMIIFNEFHFFIMT